MNWKFLNQPLGKSDLSGGYAPEKKRIWPAIAMAAVAAGSAIYGGIKSSQKNREAQRELEAEQAKTDAERRRRMYENPLGRADVQNLIRYANSEADKIYKKEAGNAAMTGATERAAMAKEYGNNMKANVIADIAANDAARKDAVDASYRAKSDQLKQQQIALQQQQGQNIANVAGQVSSAFGQAAMSMAGTGSPGGGGVSTGQPSGLLAGMGNSKSFFENYANNYIKGMYGGNTGFSLTNLRNSPLFTTNYRQFFGI